MTIPPFYSVEIITPSGETVETIDNPISLVAARSYTAVGSSVLTLLPNYDEEFFRYNMRFRLWRTDSAYGKSLFGDTVWFLRKFTNNVSQRNFAIEMADALTLLSNPVVAYTAQTPYADKTLEELGDITYDSYYHIDNLMKEYVRENFSSDALDVARRNPFIVVEQNHNMAPYGEKAASWAKLNSVLSDLARMSAEKGMELFYDLIPQSNNTFMFKVWRDIRGVDRGFSSSASIIFSDENGDLDDVQVIYDYSQMATYCYVLGYDTGPSQVIVEVGNSNIIDSDPFGRIEFTANSTDNDVTSVLLADGQAALHGLRPRRVLSAKLSPASSLRYGTDFSYGDRVGVQVGGRRYDCQISAVRAEWRDAREILDIRLDGSESLWNPTYWEGSDRTPAPIVIPEASYEVPEEEPSYDFPTFGLETNTQLVAGIDSYGSVQRTSDFQNASPTWDSVYFTHSEAVEPQLLQCFVVDPFSPGYIDTPGGTINGWAVNQDGIWRLTDLFGATPGAELQHQFAATDKMYEGTYAIAASFGAYFETANPWIIVTAAVNRAGGTVDPDDGVWAIYSQDAGATWSAEVKVSTPAPPGTTHQTTQRPAVWTSPRTPGYALTFAYTSDTLVEAYQSTDWGATWQPFTVPVISDPAVLIPRIWVANTTSSTLVSNELAFRKEIFHSVAADSEGPALDTSEQHEYCIAPPADAVRMVLKGSITRTWSRDNTTHNVLSGTLQLNDHSSHGLSHDYAPPTISGTTGSSTDNFEIVWTKSSGLTWTGNREAAEVSVTPTGVGVAQYCRFSVVITAQSSGTNHNAEQQLEIEFVVTEIELSGGSIYNPGEDYGLWAGQGLGGGVHVPWPDNADESVIYFGRLIPGTTNLFTLHRYDGSTVTDITPTDATGGYGPYRGLFGIRTHDNDRTKLLFCGKTEGADGWHYYSIFASSDGGDTWTQVQGPDREDEFGNYGGWEAAFAADDTNAFYIWGGSQRDTADGATSYGTVIGYTTDFGATIQDKTGNLIALESSDENLAGFIGIAGGPFA